MRTSLRPCLLLAALCAGLAAAPNASAVNLSTDGRGQVLIFPYYTVNKGNSTLISISNTQAEPKALRVRFSEHRNGQQVAAFNLYLGAYDVWTGAIVSDGPEGVDYLTAPGARLVSSDPSCTVPRLPAEGLRFSDQHYAVTQRDDGPYEISRTREGFVEVIEMGRVVDTGSEDFQPVRAVRVSDSGVPNNCGMLEAAWSLHGGRWQGDVRNASVGIASPSGGLRGSSVFVNPAIGVAFSVAPTALEGFFNASPNCAPDCASSPGENLHGAPDSSFPSLASARDAEGDASALIVQGNQSYRMRFAGDNAGLKATSAVLMQRAIANEFLASEFHSQFASSEWVVSFPTRRLHLNQTAAGERLPFVENYVSPLRNASSPLLISERGCESAKAQVLDRSARPVSESGIWFPGVPRPRNPIERSLCSSSRVFSFEAGAPNGRVNDVVFGDHASNLRSRVFGAYAHQSVDFGSRTEGWMHLQLGEPARNFLHANATADLDPHSVTNLLTGLPAIGFWASDFFAGGVGGTLANYAIFAPHSGERGLVTATVTVADDGSVSWQPAQP